MKPISDNQFYEQRLCVRRSSHSLAIRPYVTLGDVQGGQPKPTLLSKILETPSCRLGPGPPSDKFLGFLRDFFGEISVIFRNIPGFFGFNHD